MSDYTPKPGDKVFLTVRAAVTKIGTLLIEDAHPSEPQAHPAWVQQGAPCVVRVEPAPVELPTGFAARVRATVRGRKGVVLALADPDDHLQWKVAPVDVDRVGREWVAGDELSDVEILDAGGLS